MRSTQRLWIVTSSTPVSFAEPASTMMGEKALALTVLAPPRHDIAKIEAIFDHEPDIIQLQMRFALFAAAHGISVRGPEVREVPSLDWLKKVASDFPPIKIGRWTIHGALHRAKVPLRLRALQIDATNAFGTGEHPTTRGCLIMLDKLLKANRYPASMADIGCGSGILAMAAQQVARRQAVAIDLDGESVLIARQNCRTNGLTSYIRATQGRGYASALVRRHGPYDLIMANIFARPLCYMARDLKKNLRPHGVAILSGLLTSQAKAVITAHRMQGLALIEQKKIGEWSVLALRHPGRAL